MIWLVLAFIGVTIIVMIAARQKLAHDNSSLDQKIGAISAKIRRKNSDFEKIEDIEVIHHVENKLKKSTKPSGFYQFIGFSIMLAIVVYFIASKRLSEAEFFVSIVVFFVGSGFSGYGLFFTVQEYV